MKVLLINPLKHEMHKKNIWKIIDTRLPSLGLAYIASYLVENGIEVKIIDLAVEKLSKEELICNINNFKPNFVGITASTVTINGALSIAKICKSILPDVKVVLGGAHASVMAEDILKEDCVDFVVRGEGELVFKELIKNYKKPGKILGISYKKGNKIINNPSGKFINNLDELPFPAWQLLPMKKYRPSLGNYKRLPAMSMLCSRGCPGRCTYCYAKGFGKKLRSRSADNIIKEIKELIRKYKIKEISFYDENFTANKLITKEFCRKIINEKIDITWTCSSRVDTIDKETLILMKKAGCHQISYGIESADEVILKNIKKPIPLDKAITIVKLTKEAGIDARANFMLGSPGETKETMNKTLQFAINLDPDLAIFNITTPLPGTEMFEWAEKHNYLKTTDWKDYDFSKHIMDLPTVDSKLVEEYYKKSHKYFYLRFGFLVKKFLKTGISKKNIKAFVNLIRS